MRTSQGLQEGVSPRNPNVSRLNCSPVAHQYLQERREELHHATIRPQAILSLHGEVQGDRPSDCPTNRDWNHHEPAKQEVFSHGCEIGRVWSSALEQRSSSPPPTSPRQRRPYH